LDREISRIVEGIPACERFLTVDELDRGTEELARRHPGVVTVWTAGRSRSGHPIRVVRIGDGEHTALLFGCPHPNEPVGALLLDYFSEVLAADAGARAALGYTWYIVKCADPDGTRLNEGWFKRPFTVRNYALNYFRPAPFEQVEWTFPVEYKRLRFTSPLPETRALMGLIDEVRPDFMYSLHNSGFGGVYFYVSEGAPPLYPALQSAARTRGLPLSLGEPEVPYMNRLAEAVFDMPGAKERYDFLERHSGGDPVAMIPAGTSSDDYARRSGNTFTLVCEVPYLYDPRVQDVSPSGVHRRKAVLQALDFQERAYEFVHSRFEPLRSHLAESPLRTTLEDYCARIPRLLSAERRWACTDPSLDRDATVAEAFDSLQLPRFWFTLVLGMFVRLIRLSGGDAVRSREVLGRAEEEVAARLEREVRWLENDSMYKVIPIRKLAAVQLESGLRAAAYVRARGG